MMEMSVVLPQPDWPTSSVIWPAAYVHIDAAQGHDLGIAVAEFLGHAAADDGAVAAGVHRANGVTGRQRCACVHRHHPRNTTAGSRYSTLTMLNRLDRTTMTPTAAAVPTSTCHGMKKASRLKLRHDLAKQRGQSNAQAVADETHGERLRQHHADDA